MAEIRKHNPAAGALGDLVRAAIGDGPRPVQPGTHQGHSEDPFDASSPTSAASAPGKAAPAATFMPAVGEWKAVAINQLPTVAPTRPRPGDRDDEDFEDEDFDDDALGLDLDELDED